MDSFRDVSGDGSKLLFLRFEFLPAFGFMLYLSCGEMDFSFHRKDDCS